MGEDGIDETALNELLEENDEEDFNVNKVTPRSLFEVLRAIASVYFSAMDREEIEKVLESSEVAAVRGCGLGFVVKEEDKMDVWENSEATKQRETRHFLQAKQRCKDREEKRIEESSEGNGNKDGDMAAVAPLDQCELKRAAREQIFSTSTAFKRLLKEFCELHKYNIENKYREFISVEAIEDSVYEWDVKFMNFSTHEEGKNISADLADLKQKFGYDYVQVRVSLKEDLHPFYPPKMVVVRPRLEGIVASAMCAHPKFRLKNWQPMTSMTEILVATRKFLERFARVDVNCAANNMRSFQTGAYEDRLSKLEFGICTLTCSGETPLIPKAFEVLYEKDSEMSKLAAERSMKSDDMIISETFNGGGGVNANVVLSEEMEKLNASIKSKQNEQQQESKTRQRGFHSGIGYGSDSVSRSTKSTAWDTKTSKKMQDVHDRSISIHVNSATAALNEISERQSSGKVDKDCEKMSAVFENSALISFLARELKICNFENMADRSEYYTSLLNCVLIFCKTFVELSREAFEQYDNMREVTSQAKTFLKIQNSTTATALVGDLDDGLKEKINNNDDDDDETNNKRSPEESVLENLAKFIVDVGKVVDCNATIDLTGDFDDDKELKQHGMKSKGSNKRKSDEQAYSEALGQFQFANFPLAESSLFKTEIVKQSMKPNMGAIARAVAGISRSLPLSSSSSAFVRVDENQAQLWSMLITGPEDTPYDSGAFIFDVMLPPDFPNKPPKVLIKTTGGGTVRFNPNLYNEGKVCLSLLGTWQGSDGEEWNPSASTMLQVIVSIQSLILVPDPYFNEPGWEKDRGTDAGDKNDFEYSAKIKGHTLDFAMLDHIRRINKKKTQKHAQKDHPFDEVLRTHFLRRRDHILGKLKNKWLTDAKEHKYSPGEAHASSLQKKFADLETELRQL